MSGENKENLQSTVRELVKEALSTEMQRFQEAAGATASKQIQAASKLPEGIYLHKPYTIGLDISRQTLSGTGMIREMLRAHVRNFTWATTHTAVRSV